MLEVAVWIIAALLLMLIIFVYFMHDDLSGITKQHTHLLIWLEKIEKKLDDVDKRLKQQMDEARNRHIR